MNKTNHININKLIVGIVGILGYLVIVTGIIMSILILSAWIF